MILKVSWFPPTFQPVKSFPLKSSVHPGSIGPCCMAAASVKGNRCIVRFTVGSVALEGCVIDCATGVSGVPGTRDTQTGVEDGLMPTTKSTVELLKKHGFAPLLKESPGGHTW